MFIKEKREMNKLRVSVIIPVYNSEKYLDKCVNSILNQTYKDIQIILVDDGSTDSSPDICDMFSKKDNRVIAVHQRNGGTSKARNTGLKLAEGDYITFADNDDYWKDNNCLEKIVAYLENSHADMLFHVPYIFWQDTNEMIEPKRVIRREEINGKDFEKALNLVMERGLMDRCVWSKFFKKSVIKDNGITFPENCRNEDTYFIGEIFMYADTLDWYEDSFYVYRKGHEGAQTSKRLAYKSLKDLENLVIDYIEMIKSSKLKDERKETLYNFIAYLYSVWMGQQYLVDRQQNKEALKKDKIDMKKYSYILNYDVDPNVALINKVCRLLGFTLTSKLLGIYIKHNNHQ
jgi:glycosyltransferase involved in cell wall biosynthesis